MYRPSVPFPGRFLAFLLCAAAFGLSAPRAAAQTAVWNGADGTGVPNTAWEDGNNWTGETAPYPGSGNTDSVRFGATGNPSLTDCSLSTSGLTLTDFLLEDGVDWLATVSVANTVTLTINGNLVWSDANAPAGPTPALTLLGGGTARVDVGGTATWSDGTLTVGGGATLTSGSDFTLNDNGALSNSGTIQVGRDFFLAGSAVLSNGGVVEVARHVSVQNAASVSGSGKILLNGSARQDFTDGSGNSLGNLEINKTGGGGNDDVVFQAGTSPHFVDLTLTSGQLRFDTSDLPSFVSGNLTHVAGTITRGAGEEFVFTGKGSWSAADAGGGNSVNFGDVRIAAGAVVTLAGAATTFQVDSITVEAGAVLALNGKTLSVGVSGPGLVVSGKAFTWIGSGNWSTPANWSPAGPPGGSDLALFDASGAGNCTVDVASSAESLLLASGNTRSLILTNQSLSLAKLARITAGTLDLSGATAFLGAVDLELDGGTLLLGDGTTVSGEPFVCLQVSGTLTVTANGGTLTPDTTLPNVGGILLNASGGRVDLRDDSGGPTSFGRLVHAGGNDVRLQTNVTVGSFTGTSGGGKLDLNDLQLTVAGDAAGTGLVMRNATHFTNKTASTPDIVFSGASGNMSWSTTTPSENFLEVRIASAANTVTLGSNVTCTSLDLQGRLSLGSSRTLTADNGGVRGTVTASGTAATLLGTGSLAANLTVSGGTTTVAGTVATQSPSDLTLQNAALLLVDGGSLTTPAVNGDQLIVQNMAALTVRNGGVCTIGDDINWSSSGTLTVDATSRFLFGDDWATFSGGINNSGSIETAPAGSADPNGRYDLRATNATPPDFGHLVNVAGVGAGQEIRLRTDVILTSYQQGSAEGIDFNLNKITISGGGNARGLVVDAPNNATGNFINNPTWTFTGTSVWDDNTAGNAVNFGSVTIATGAIVSLRQRLAHTGVTGTLAVGETVTGQTSGATAVVSEVAGSYLEVVSVSGTFQNGEKVQKNGSTTDFVTLSAAPAPGNITVTDLVVQGTLKLNGAKLAVTGTLDVRTGGVIETGDGGEVEVQSTATALDLAGTIDARGSGTGGVVDFDVPFPTATGTGTLTFGNGTLQLVTTADFSATTVSFDQAGTGQAVFEPGTYTVTVDADADPDTFAAVSVQGTVTLGGTSTLNVGNGGLTTTGSLDAGNDTLIVSGPLNESTGTLTADTVQLVGDLPTQTVTLNAGLAVGALTVNHGTLATDQVVVAGSGSLTATTITLTRGTIVPQVNIGVTAPGAGTALTVATEGRFQSSTDGLTHSFANAGGAGNVVVVDGNGVFSFVDPADNATPCELVISDGDTVDLNGSASFTLTGQPGAKLLFRDDNGGAGTGLFAVAADAGATVDVSQATIRDSDGGGGAQSPLVAVQSTLEGNTTNWVVGIVWTGAAGDDLWSTGGNWQGGSPPGPTENAIFNATSQAGPPPSGLGTLSAIGGIVVLPAYAGGTPAGAIRIDNVLTLAGNLVYTPDTAAPATSKIDLTGGTLVVRGDATVNTRLGTGTGTLRFDAPGGASTLTPGATSANIDLTLEVGSADSNTSLTLAGTNTLTVASLVVDDQTAGGPTSAFSTGSGPTSSLTLGSVTLENQATFTGNATAITLSGNWSSGGGTALGGGTLTFAGTSQSFATAAGDSFGDLVVQGAPTSVTASGAFAASLLDIQTNNSFAGTFDATLSGNLTNAGTLTHTGGTVTFTGGGTPTLDLGGASLNALTVTGGTALATGGNVTVAGATTVTGSDNSSLTLGASHALDTASLVVDRGVVDFGATGGGSIGAGGISFGPTGTRALNLRGNVTLRGPLDTTPNDASAFTHAGTLTLADALTIETSAKVKTFAALVMDDGGGGKTATLGGTGTLTATTVTVTSGTLDLAVDTSFGGAVSVSGTLSSATAPAGTRTHVFGSTVTVNAGGIFRIGDVAGSFGGVTARFAAGAAGKVSVASGGRFEVRGTTGNFMTLESDTPGSTWQLDVANTTDPNTDALLTRATIRDGAALTVPAIAVRVQPGFNATPSTNTNWDFGTKTTTWTNGTGDSLWSTIGNWTNGPPNSGAGDTVLFSAVGGASNQDIAGNLSVGVLNMTNFTGTLNLSQPLSVGGLTTVVSTLNQASAFSTGGLTLTAGSVYAEGTADTTLSGGDLTVDPTATWQNDPAGTLVFAKDAAGADAQSWSGSGAGAAGVGEVRIDNGNATAGEGLTVTLTGSATATQVTVANNQGLRVNDGAKLTAQTSLDVQAGGTLVAVTPLVPGGDVLDVRDFILAGTYAETSRDTRVRGDLTVSGTWTNHTVGTLVLDSAGAQSWNGSGSGSDGVGEVSLVGGAGTVTLVTTDATVRTVSIGAGKTLADGGRTFTVLGDGASTTPLGINATGTFTGTGTTILAASTGITVPTTRASYANLTLSNPGADTLEGSESISGVLTIDTGSLATGAFALSAAGITGTGTLNAATSPGITTTGGLDVANFTAGAALTFNGTGNWGGSATTFGAVTIQSGTLTATADLVVDSLASTGGSLALGNFAFQSAGSVDLVGVAVTQNAAGQFRLTGGGAQVFDTDGDTVGTLLLQGTNQDITLSGALATTGAVTPNAGNDLFVPAGTGIDVGGLLTVPAGSVFDVDAASTFRGGATVDGQFLANTGGLTLAFGNGSTVQVNAGGSLVFDDAGAAQIDLVGVTSGSTRWNFRYQPAVIAHGAVANGPFAPGERVTGGTSGAVAYVGTVNAGSLDVGFGTGTFQAGETITGATSGASATVTTFTASNVTVNDVRVRDSDSSPPTRPGGANINLGNNVGWKDLSDLNAVWTSGAPNNAADDWNDTRNWQSGALPTNGSVVQIDPGATVGPQDKFDQLPGPVTTLGGLSIPDAWNPGSSAAETVRFNADVTINGTLAIGAGSTVDANAANFGVTTANGAGTLDVAGATTVTVTNALAVGTYVKPTAGTLRLQGTLSGASNFGDVVLTGATALASPVAVDSLDLSSNALTLGAANDLDVGSGGVSDAGAAGTLDASGAKVNTAGGLVVGTYVPGTLLTFDGTGTWGGGANPNFGSVAVTAGTVTLGAGVTATALDVNGGTLDTSAAGSHPLTATTLQVRGGGTLLGNSSVVQPLTSLDSTGGTVTLAPTGVVLFNNATATVTGDGGDSLGVFRLQGASTVDLAGTVGAGSLDLQAGTLRGNAATFEVDTNWSVSAGATFDPGTSTVDFRAGFAHVLTLAGASEFYDLTLSGGATSFALPNLLKVRRDLSVAGGASLAGPTNGVDVDRNVTCAGSFAPANLSTTTVGGDWDFSGGTFTQSNDTLAFDGGGVQNLTAGAGDFYEVQIVNGGTLTQQTAATVSHQLVVANGVLDQNGQTLTLTSPTLPNPLVVTLPTGSINGNGGTLIFATGLAGSVTVPPAGSPGYHNLRLDTTANPASFTNDLGAIAATGDLFVDSAPQPNTFVMAADVTVGSLSGSGVFDMNNTSFTLRLTGSGTPLSLFPTRFANGSVAYASSGAAATINAGFVYSNLLLEGNKSYPTSGALTVTRDLTLTGGATFAGAPTLTFGGTTNSFFRGNNSAYTLGVLEVAKATAATSVTVVGSAGATRAVNDLRVTTGTCDVNANLTVLAGQVASGATFLFDSPFTTLTLGAEDGALHQFDVRGTARIGGGNSDVTLELAGDNNTTLTELRLASPTAILELRGNAFGSGTTPNLIIRSTTTGPTGNTPRITETGTAGRPAANLDVRNVDVADNDCNGITLGNQNDSGTYTGAGIEATGSSQLNANTPGWIFKGGGSIAGLYGEAVNNASGAIDTVRIFFGGGADLNPATLGSVHTRFTLVRTDGAGNVLASLPGTAASIPLNSRILEVSFGAGIGQTDLSGLEVRYSAPPIGSAFLRNQNGTPASQDFTLSPGGPTPLVDGAAPVLVSAAGVDADGDGRPDFLDLQFSEPVGFSAGGGWSVSGFQPVTDTTQLGSNQFLTLEIAGEQLAPIQLDINGNQFNGADIAAEIQRQVRAVMNENPPGSSNPGGHNPLNRPAYLNFTCTYSETDERYVLSAGLPLAWDAARGRYVFAPANSTVRVLPTGANDAAPFLELGTANGGSEGAGYGDALPAVSASGNVDLVSNPVAGTTLSLSLNGEASRDYALSTGATSLALAAAEIEALVRDEANNPADLGANQPAYSDFVVVPDDTGVSGPAQRFVFVSTQGSAARITVDSASSFATAAGMGLGTPEVSSVTTADDVGGSLGGRHFLISSPSTDYYVWFDVDNTSLDPAVAGRTGIEVDIASNAPAATVASALEAALEATGAFDVAIDSLNKDQLTVTNRVPGPATDASDATTGFAIAVASQGTSVPGAQEVAGSENTVASLEDFLVTSARGENLLLGKTAADLSLVGNSLRVGLADAAGSGAGVPGYLIADRNENGGFVTDRAGWTNPAATLANVAAADGIVLAGDTDGDGIVDADPSANILVDASNTILPFGSSGVTARYRWTLVSAPGTAEATQITAVADSPPGTLNGTYFLIDAPAQPFYVWIDVGNTGTDPAVSGRTGIEVDIASGATADAVAGAIAAALDAQAAFSASAAGNVVSVTNAVNGAVADAADGTTGFAIATTTQGDGGVTQLTQSSGSILDFGAQRAGTYRWRLTLTVLDASGAPVAVPLYTDGNGQVEASVEVRVSEVAPVADAGGDARVIGTRLALDGSGSFDPNGGVGSFTYQWTARDAAGNLLPSTVFQNGTGSGATPDKRVDPDFVPGASGVYSVSLTVTKTSDPTLTATDTVQVIVDDPANLLPVAEAGPPLIGRIGQLITLQGGASADPEGDALNYQWTVVSAPEPVVLGAPTTATPTFTPGLPGSYTFELRVSDSLGVSGPPDRVTLQVVDDRSTSPRRPPASAPAVAGLEHAVFLTAAPNLSPTPPDLVLADGTRRRATVVDLAGDPGDDPAAGATQGLFSVRVFVNSALFATLYGPLEDGDFPVTGLRFSGSSADEAVYAFGRAGASFVLDATQSQDDGAVTGFLWTQTGGPFKFATRAGNLISVIPQTAGTYRFELSVTDNLGLGSLPREVDVKVLPAAAATAGPPTARATITGGATLVDGTFAASPGNVTLDAAQSISLSTGVPVTGSSSDLTYRWRQLEGPTAVLTNATSLTATAALPRAGAYRFELEVTDGNGVSDRTTLWVSAKAPASDAPVAGLRPVADLVLANGGEAVISFDGSQSSGKTPLTAVWSQTAGVPTVVDGSGLGGQARVVRPGTYTFELRVVDADGVVSPPASVTFHVRESAPAGLPSGAEKSGKSGCALGAPSSAGASPAALWFLALFAGLLGLRGRKGGRP